MFHTIACFPWFVVPHTINCGAIRLLPYRRGAEPGSCIAVAQSDIDGVLSAYADSVGRPVTKATLLEVDDWHSGSDAHAHIQRLFDTKNFIAFSALCNRRLFCGHIGYSNYDCFSLVVQNYQPGAPGMYSFMSRRRDGITNHLRGTDRYKFTRPNHVDDHARPSLDLLVLEALQKLHPKDHDYLIDALVEFCLANTDSPDVPKHVEIVMMKSAFERLLKINQKVDKFVEKLTQIVGKQPHLQVAKYARSGWQAARPKSPTPLEAWAREFCDLRGNSAHGNGKNTDRYNWGANAHLAFASILFPLIFKAVLEQKGLYRLQVYDRERLNAIDYWLLNNPFSPRFQRLQTHPWVHLDNYAMLSASMAAFECASGMPSHCGDEKHPHT